ncbi:hypothetical protein [Halorarius litoreus]|uniref:hypothetical protein n=1 Tax=Halorarius litoreus TaxID=2962676 RepID=UPI0020CDC170|nr:hypothetical protein [Halorarius litoreus]
MVARRLLQYVAGGLGLFLAVGVGVGLAQNFTLSFLIEQLVDPGGNPLDNTLVGIVIVVDIITPFSLGPLVAAGVGLVTGAGYDDREGVAAFVAGAVSGVGFVLMTLVALLLTFAVLQQYGTGGAGGGDSPFSPSALVPTVIQAGIPMTVVGGAAAYIRARLA